MTDFNNYSDIICWPPIESGTVRRVSLDVFAQGKRFDVKPYHHPDNYQHGRRIVAAAMRELGQRDYNLVTHNCWNFVNQCVDIARSHDFDFPSFFLDSSGRDDRFDTYPVGTCLSIARPSGISHTAIYIGSDRVIEFVAAEIDAKVSELSMSNLFSSSTFQKLFLSQAQSCFSRKPKYSRDDRFAAFQSRFNRRAPDPTTLVKHFDGRPDPSAELAAGLVGLLKNRTHAQIILVPDVVPEVSDHSRVDDALCPALWKKGVLEAQKFKRGYGSDEEDHFLAEDFLQHFHLRNRNHNGFLVVQSKKLHPRYMGLKLASIAVGKNIDAAGLPRHLAQHAGTGTHACYAASERSPEIMVLMVSADSNAILAFREGKADVVLEATPSFLKGRCAKKVDVEAMAAVQKKLREWLQ